MTALALLMGLGACVENQKEVQDDSNTPLHLLQRAYDAGRKMAEQ